MLQECSGLFARESVGRKGGVVPVSKETGTPNAPEYHQEGVLSASSPSDPGALNDTVEDGGQEVDDTSLRPSSGLKLQLTIALLVAALLIRGSIKAKTLKRQMDDIVREPYVDRTSGLEFDISGSIQTPERPIFGVVDDYPMAMVAPPTSRTPVPTSAPTPVESVVEQSEAPCVDAPTV